MSPTHSFSSLSRVLDYLSGEITGPSSANKQTVEKASSLKYFLLLSVKEMIDCLLMDYSVVENLFTTTFSYGR